MHGRVKTRSTAEQQAVKAAERKKKVEFYKLVTKTLIEKRKSQIYDEEVLTLTAQLLLSNSDITSLWNYRREVFLFLKERQLDPSDFQSVLAKDLILTEQCLRSNPKSYGSWHHRVWVLDHLPEPDWEKELKVCSRYLDMDERNFHCWDYRKIICDRAKVSAVDEFKYSTEKIIANFSNYSSWHYRSKLLPIIFPDSNQKLPISEAQHREELELVENAAFTDPNDQSAWFYQRWLLGFIEPKIHFMAGILKEDSLIVGFSKSICLLPGNQQHLVAKVERVNEKTTQVTGTWTNSDNIHFNSIWQFNFPNDSCDIKVISLYQDDIMIDEIKLVASQKEDTRFMKAPNFAPHMNDKLMSVLEDEYNSCEQLLELEPDSKWTLLTGALLMKFIDSVKYKDKIEQTIKKLKEVDYLRLGYYSDLQSKITIEHEILTFFNGCTTVHDETVAIFPNNDRLTFNLSNLRLTALYYMQSLCFVNELDLSNNELSSESLTSLKGLKCCQNLNLNNNKIKTLAFLPKLASLVRLKVENNFISDMSGLQTIRFFVSLKELYLKNNNVTATADLHKQFQCTVNY